MATPNGRLRSSQQQVSLGIPRFVSGGLAKIQVGVNGARTLPNWFDIDVDLDTTTNNFASNEYRGVVNPSGLVVYKESNATVESNGDCNRKVKVESKVKM